eukprot:9783274-Alexandrium_andersonii.AAC.1
MSASLVGSEMCIRDRFVQIPNLPTKAAVHGVRSLPEACPTLAHHTDRPKPVSYTHLTLPTICSV